MPIRNPVFSQSSRLPLYKEKLRILTKLRKKVVKAKRFWKINAIWPEIKARRGRNEKKREAHKLPEILLDVGIELDRGGPA